MSGTPAAAPELVASARARVRQLRAEADVATDRTVKAALLYEAGYFNEVLLGQPAQAVQDYLAAYNTDNRSRLPLHALVRMFERRRSYKNLTRLYDAEVRSARSPAERGHALTSQALLGRLTNADDKVVQARLEQALAQEPRADASLLLEWNRRAAGDLDGALHALAKRAESSDDPTHRGALLLEIAALRETRGEIGSALEALRAAALAPECAEESYAIALGRFARQHGFTEELVEASERRAARLAEELKERAADLESDPLLLQRLRSRAVAHWYEAARLRSASLSDPLGALRAIDGALQHAPNDLLFRYLRMLTYDLLEDRERAAEEARKLLAAGLEGPQAAALHFRLAEHALVTGDSELAREKLVETIAVGGSAAAAAILDDLLLDEGRNEDRIAQREALAEQLAATDLLAAVHKLCEAAQIAAAELKDAARALQLYQRADRLAPDHALVLREAYGSALDLRDDALARFALTRLLAHEQDPERREVLRHHRFELASEDERDALIDEELAESSPSPSVVKLALAHAASRKDYPRLCKLHLARASAVSGEEAAAELCAAARAALRAGHGNGARGLLERALEHAPAQRYALTLLEEVLRRQGDAEAAIALLRNNAATHQSERDAELSLLAAGSAAELAGDVYRAEQSYLEAASRETPSLGALWALLRLAQRRRAPELERSARAGLAERERSQSRAGVDTVLLAEHYDLADQQPDHAEPLLQRALQDDDVGHHAAMGLALSRSAPLALRAEAIELLATRATDALRPALLRELGGELLARNAPPARVMSLVERTGNARADDRWSLFTRTHVGLALRPDEHARALASFATVTTDGQLASIARAEALWSEQRAAPSRPLGTTLRQLLDVEDGQEPPLTPELAQMVLALGSPVEDDALRASALEVALRNAEPEARSTLLLAHARARLARDDAAGALSALEELLAREPASLAGWELAYEAAERAGRPAMLAEAAEKLGDALSGEAAVDLLEQAAVVRADRLGDRAGAERLFTRVLALAPERVTAFQRLHALLSARDAHQELLALVRDRRKRVDDPEELIRLNYELARSERARGELEAALESLNDVLMLDDENLGALALSAEIQTARGKFREAVDALDRLGGASSLPKQQRRLALLGAADFLEHKLDDREGALTRLSRLLALTPDDAQAHVRFADLAERHQAFERVPPALERAIELEGEPGQKVALSARLGDLLANQLGKKVEAVSVYRRVLEWAPDHVGVARALLRITDDAEVVSRLELELRAKLREQPRDPALLRGLLELSELTRDRDLAFVALSALDALDALAEGEETTRFRELLASARSTAIARDAKLSEGELRSLLAPSVDGRGQQLLRTVFAAAAELEQLDPARFGVGRGQRIHARDPHALREDLRALAGPLGLNVGDVYVGGKDAHAIAALPREGELGFVLGSDVESPLTGAARQRAALQLAAVHMQTLPLLTRGAEGGTQLLHAALLAENCPLPAGVDRAALSELARTVGKQLPRKVKRALPELWRALPEGSADLLAHCQHALSRTRRLSLLLSGELSAALREVGPDEPAQLDLLRTWLGASISTSRRKLGLTL